MQNAIDILRSELPGFDFAFFSAVAESGTVDGVPCIRLYNGDVLTGFSDWTKTYYATHFERRGEAFRALNIEEFAFGAAFDGLISYHFENSWPLAKSLYLRRDAIVLDVGVRAGHWLVKAARMTGPDSRIVGIDATEFSETNALRHIRINRLQERCSFVRAAVGAVDRQRRKFYRGSSGETYSGFYPVTRQSDGAEVVRNDVHLAEEEIEARTIDALVHSLGLKRLDMIVLQINGAEREALVGARETLRQYGPLVYVTNYHSEAGGGQHDSIAGDLSAIGYRVLASSDTCRVFGGGVREG